MGMRRNIALEYPPVDGKRSVIFLYTHWGAEGLENELAEILDKDIARARWNDDSYLARIIASNLLKGTEDSETGYGLAPYIMDPEFPTLQVDLQEKTVNGLPFEDFIKNPEVFKI